jgi:hypothetical protein
MKPGSRGNSIQDLPRGRNAVDDDVVDASRRGSRRDSAFERTSGPPAWRSSLGFSLGGGAWRRLADHVLCAVALLATRLLAAKWKSTSTFTATT